MLVPWCFFPSYYWKVWPLSRPLNDTRSYEQGGSCAAGPVSLFLGQVSDYTIREDFCVKKVSYKELLFALCRCVCVTGLSILHITRRLQILLNMQISQKGSDEKNLCEKGCCVTYWCATNGTMNSKKILEYSIDRFQNVNMTTSIECCLRRIGF